MEFDRGWSVRRSLCRIPPRGGLVQAFDSLPSRKTVNTAQWPCRIRSGMDPAIQIRVNGGSAGDPGDPGSTAGGPGPGWVPARPSRAAQFALITFLVIVGLPLAILIGSRLPRPSWCSVASPCSAPPGGVWGRSCPAATAGPTFASSSATTPWDRPDQGGQEPRSGRFPLHQFEPGVAQPGGHLADPAVADGVLLHRHHRQDAPA